MQWKCSPWQRLPQHITLYFPSTHSMGLFGHHLLFALFATLYASFLDFPTSTIRRLRALDVIGGYPSFIEEVYIETGPLKLGRNEIRSYYRPLSTIPRFSHQNAASCQDSNFTSYECELKCSRNDPNCTAEQQADQEGSLLNATAALREEQPFSGYVYGDEIRTNGHLALLRPAVNAQCTQSFKQPMKYNVNYTASCAWHFGKVCNVSKLVKFLSGQITGTEVCEKTGDQCFAPILRDIPVVQNHQKCDNYTTMTVRLATQQGALLGMLIKFTPTANRCHKDYCIVTTEIFFHEISQKFMDKMKMSRYENSEGRFRCPSEVTCPAELLYFLNLLDPGTFGAQFWVLVPLLLLSLLYLCVKNVEPSLPSFCFPFCCCC